MLAIVLLVIASVLLVRTPFVQTKLVQYFAGRLSERLHARVDVERVDIEFFRRIILGGVLVKDLHGDTLLYVKKLNAGLKKFDRKTGDIYLSNIAFERPVINLRKYKGEERLNFAFLLDALSDTTKSDSSLWTIRCTSFRIMNGFFSYRDYTKQPIPWGIDFGNIALSRLNGNFSGVKVKGDTLSAVVKDLSFIEKSGFRLNKFSTKIQLNSKEFSLVDLLMQTPFSEIHTDIKFTYEAFRDFNHFLSKVRFNAGFQHSGLSFHDIAFFAPDLQGLAEHINFSGNFRGTVDNLKGKNIEIKYGRATVFKGKINLTGLPDMKETYIDMAVEELRTMPADLERFPLPPFDKKKVLAIPLGLKPLGAVAFKGKFTGFFNDFVSYGTFSTALGNITSDINVKYDQQTQETNYSGHLATDNFNIGKLLAQEKHVGSISMSADVKGSGLTLDKLNAKLSGQISSIEIERYSYQHISLDGTIRKKLFKGSMDVKDNNFALAFNGEVDFSRALPVMDFTASLSEARLSKLGLIKRDTSSSLSASFVIHFTGNNIDNLDGALIMDKIKYAEKGHTYFFKRFALTSSPIAKGKTINFSSDLFDFSVTGLFRSAYLFDSFRHIISGILPSWITVPEPPFRQKFEYSLVCKNTHAASDLFFPALRLNPGANLSGHFNSGSSEFGLKIEAPSFLFNNILFEKFELNAAAKQHKASLTSSFSSIRINDSLEISGASLDASVADDSVALRLQLSNRPEEPNRTDLKANLLFADASFPGKVVLRIQPSDVYVNNTPWLISEGNSVVADSAFVMLNNVVFTNGNQSVGLFGTFSGSSYQQLQFGLTNFSLSNFRKLLSSAGINLDGTINGKVMLIGNFSRYGISSSLAVSALQLNGEYMGKASVNSTWDSQSRLLSLTAGITEGETKIIDVKGKYNMAQAADNLDFTINIQSLYLKKFERYVSDVFSGLVGKAYGALHVTGTFAHPVTNGVLKLQNTAFVLTYINTRYSFTHEFTVKDNQVIIENLQINENTDIAGISVRQKEKNISKLNTLLARGKFFYEQEKGMRFDMEFSSSHMKCLNTKATDNTLFYGSVYGSGVVKLQGDLKNVFMDIALRAEKGDRNRFEEESRFYIPLENMDEIEQSDFIKFVTVKANVGKADRYKVNLSGMRLNLAIEMTPDAEVQIIFDSKIGDIIKGSGSGDIRMEIDTKGAFNMYGEYVIEQGDYLFTMQNVINRRFKIEKGSTIRWAGNPYEALVDLDAVYHLRASLYDLLQDTTYRKRIPVDCHLHMSNKLFNPNIRFSVVVPNIDNATETQIKRFINNEQETNNQVFSLLVMNRFTTPSQLSNAVQNTASSGSGVGANASELLSNQLSNWASRISNDFDIGVKYRTGDAVSKEQIELGLSTRLFNDRVIVDGRVGNNQSLSSQNTSTVVGDFNVEVKVSGDGRLRLKAFNRSNTNILQVTNSPYTQGVGVFYREEFNTLPDLLKRYRLWKKKAT